MIRGLDKGQRAALLISECQRGVLDASRSLYPTLVEQVHSRGILPRIARLAQAFRDAKLPVVHLHVAHRPGYVDQPRTSAIMMRSIKSGAMLAGTPDVESLAEVAPQSGDILHARSYSLVAFHGTDLDQILRNLGVQTVVLTGVSTNVAISGSALCASDLGYQAIVPEDCIAGATADSHAYLISNLLPLYATLSDFEAVQRAISMPA